MEKYILLKDAVGLLPAKVSAATLWRWCVRGFYLRAVDQIVQLKFIYIGRKMATTQKWIDEFLERLTIAKMADVRHRNSPKPGSKESGRTLWN